MKSIIMMKKYICNNRIRKYKVQVTQYEALQLEVFNMTVYEGGLNFLLAQSTGNARNVLKCQIIINLMY